MYCNIDTMFCNNETLFCNIDSLFIYIESMFMNIETLFMNIATMFTNIKTLFMNIDSIWLEKFLCDSHFSGESGNLKGFGGWYDEMGLQIGLCSPAYQVLAPTGYSGLDNREPSLFDQYKMFLI